MKPIIIKIFYFTILLLLSTAVLFAQSAKQTKVSGSLLDEQGKPLDYATVSLLKAQDSSIVKGTLSGQAGDYLFDHVNSGSYIVRATVVGYQKVASKPFTITEGSPSVIIPALLMRPGSKSLATVTVTSSKPLIERKIDRTVMNVENSVLAAGNTALEILERAPGVSVDKDDNISLKGKQGVTVMINDKLTYLTSAQLATLLRSTDGNTI